MAPNTNRVACSVFLLESIFIFAVGWLLFTSSSSTSSWGTMYTKKSASTKKQISRDEYKDTVMRLFATRDGRKFANRGNHSGQLNTGKGLLMNNCPNGWYLHVIRDGKYPAQVCRNTENSHQWKCAPRWRKLLRDPYCIFADRALNRTFTNKNFTNRTVTNKAFTNRTFTNRTNETKLESSVRPTNVSKDIKWARVSHRRKNMFLQVPHSGSNFIETSFLFENATLQPGDKDGNLYPASAWHGKEPFQNYHKYCMVRHPCSRLISLWKHLSKNDSYDGLAPQDAAKLKKYTHNIDLFLDFFLSSEKSLEGNTEPKLHSQVEILFDETGNFEADHLFVFEKWNESTEYFAKILAMDARKLKLPGTILNDQPNCQDVYSPSAWSRMTTLYAMDLCVFGYSTDISEIFIAPQYEWPPNVLSFRFAECKIMIEKRRKSTVNMQSGKTFNKTCYVYTYFQMHQAKNMTKYLKEQNETLAAWKEAWSSAGWTPVVLTEKHAMQHPKYDEFRKKFWDLPTVNEKEYELACFLRHVAMAAVGGGWMADYDVLPLRLLPCTELPNDGEYTTHERFVPSLVSGNGTEFTRVATLMANIEWQVLPKQFLFKGVFHVSDMICARYFLNNGTIRGMKTVIAPSVFFTKPFQCNRTSRRLGWNNPLSPVAPGLSLLPWAIHFSHKSIKDMRNDNVTFPGVDATNRDVSRPDVIMAAYKFIRDLCHIYIPSEVRKIKRHKIKEESS